jgi:hypothetical protein
MKSRPPVGEQPGTELSRKFVKTVTLRQVIQVFDRFTR